MGSKKWTDTVFSSGQTQDQLSTLYEHGLTQTEPYWDFGYPLLTQALPTLRTGLVYIIAPENVGKSMFQINLAYGALSVDQEVYWIDFSLDDTIEHRLSYLLARVGGIPVNLVRQITGADDIDIKTRQDAFEKFDEEFKDRYRLYGISSLSADEDEIQLTAEQVSRISQAARQQLGPDKKLIVTVDSFHDLGLEARADDENDRLTKKSATLKAAATKSSALFILTAHSRKGSRARGMTLDIMKGTVDTGYDATVALHIYSDVHANHGNASTYWTDVNEPTKKQPVHEVNILKNKAGAERSIIFYEYCPQYCRDQEADEQQQAMYRNCVFGTP